MLGRKVTEYPRFRDCFVSEDGNIVVLTRVGGNNRNAGFGEEELCKDPHFIKTYDDEFDSTYGFYEFSVPEKWKKDFEAIKSGGIKNASDEYLKHLIEFYSDIPDFAQFLTKILNERTV